MVGQNGETVKPVHPITLREVMTHTKRARDMYKREPHWTLAETARKLCAAVRCASSRELGWAYSTGDGRARRVVSGRRHAVRPVSSETALTTVGNEGHEFLDRAGELRAGPTLSLGRANLQAGRDHHLVSDNSRDGSRTPAAGGRASLHGNRAGLPDDAHQARLSWAQPSMSSAQTVAEWRSRRRSHRRPGCPGAGILRGGDPTKMAPTSVLSPNSFATRAFSTQSWADPTKNPIWIACSSATEKAIRTIPTCASPFRTQFGDRLRNRPNCGVRSRPPN